MWFCINETSIDSKATNCFSCFFVYAIFINVVKIMCPIMKILNGTYEICFYDTMYVPFEFNIRININSSISF